jgi:hypothetical protein
VLKRSGTTAPRIPSYSVDVEICAVRTDRQVGVGMDFTEFWRAMVDEDGHYAFAVAL